MIPFAAENDTFEDSEAVPPAVLFVAATMLNTRDTLECRAFDVIADVLDVNCNPCVSRIAPPLFEKLIPFESWKLRVWNVEEASAENA